MLSSIDTHAPKFFDKIETKEKLIAIGDELASLQNLLYAESKHSILIVLQGMDASGKDGLIKDVFHTINPMGVSVHPFKVPTEEELKHDFLWRIHKQSPEKGKIAIFNRSHYEDVLVTRVHGLIDDELAAKRMKAINEFEEMLATHCNTHILKFYLHVSQKEQLQRLDERMLNPEKMWKYNKNDFAERDKWEYYMKYYEEVFDQCNKIPWHIVPSDQNWYKNYVVATTLRDLLKGLDMKYPPIEN